MQDGIDGNWQRRLTITRLFHRKAAIFRNCWMRL